MHLTRRLRKLSACLALFALLFASMATASYACPLVGDALLNLEAAVPHASPCDTLDQDQPSLCQAHCQDGQQNLSGDSVHAMPFVAAFFSTVTTASPPPAERAAASPALHHSTSPPACIRHCCFRI